MSWLASEWKNGLSPTALSKVTELERAIEHLKRESSQKSLQLDNLAATQRKDRDARDQARREISDAQREATHLEQSLAAAHRDLEKTQNELRTKENLLKQNAEQAKVAELLLRRELQDTTNRLQGAAATTSTVPQKSGQEDKENMSRLQAQIKSMQEAVSTLEHDKAALMARLDQSVKAAHTMADKRLQAIEFENGLLIKENASLKSSLDNLKIALQQARDDSANLKLAHEAILRKSASKTDDMVLELQQSLQQAKQATVQLRATAEADCQRLRLEHEQRAQGMQQQMNLAQQELQEAKVAAQQAKRTADQLEDTMAKAQMELTRRDDLMKNLKNTNAQLVQECDTLRASTTTLKESHVRATAHVETLQQQLENAQLNAQETHRRLEKANADLKDQLSHLVHRADAAALDSQSATALLQQHVQTLTQTQEQQAQALATSADQHTAMVKKQAQLQQQLEGTAQQLAQTTAAKITSEQQIHDVTVQLQLQQAAFALLQTQYTALAAENTHTVEQCAALSEQRAVAETAQAASNQTLTDLRQQLLLREEAIACLQKQHAVLQAEHTSQSNQLQSTSIEAQTTQASLTQQVKSLEEQRVNQDQSLAASAERIQSLMTEREDMAVQLKQAYTEQSELAEVRLRLEEQLRQLQLQRESGIQVHIVLQGQVTALQAERDALQQQLQAAACERQELEAIQAAAKRTEMEMSEQLEQLQQALESTKQMLSHESVEAATAAVQQQVGLNEANTNVARLTAQLAEAHEHVNAVLGAVGAAKQDTAEVRQAATAAEARAAGVQAQLDAVLTAKTQLEVEIVALSNEMCATAAVADSRQQRITALEIEIAAADEQHSSIITELEKTQQACVAAEAKVSALTDLLDTSQQAQQTSVTHTEELAAALSESNEQVAMVIAQYNQVQAHVVELEKSVQALQLELSNASNAMVRLKQQLDHAQAQETEMATETDRVIADHLQQHTATQMECIQLQTCLSEAEELLSRRQAEIVTLQLTIKTAADSTTHATALTQDIEAQLAQAQQHLRDQAETEEQLQAALQQTKKELDECKAALFEVAAAGQQLQIAAERVQLQLTEQRAELNDAVSARSSMEETIALVRQQHEEATATAAQRAQALEQLEVRLQNTEETLEQTRAQLSRARLEETNHEQVVANLRQALAEQQQDTIVHGLQQDQRQVAVQQDLAQLQTDVARLQIELANMTSQNQELISDVDEAREEESLNRQASAQQAAVLISLTGELKLLREEHQCYKVQLANATTACETEQRKCADLQEQTNELTDLLRTQEEKLTASHAAALQAVIQSKDEVQIEMQRLQQQLSEVAIQHAQLTDERMAMEAANHELENCIQQMTESLVAITVTHENCARHQNELQRQVDIAKEKVAENQREQVRLRDLQASVEENHRQQLGLVAQDAEDRVAAAEAAVLQAVDEGNTLRPEIVRLQTEVNRLTLNVDSDAQEHEQAQQALVTLQQHCDQVEERAASYKLQMQSCSDNLKQSQCEAAHQQEALQHELDGAQAALFELQALAMVASKRQEESVMENNLLQEQIKVATENMAQQQQDIARLATELQDVRAELLASQRLIECLTTASKLAEEEKWELLQETQQLKAMGLELVAQVHTESQQTENTLTQATQQLQEQLARSQDECLCLEGKVSALEGKMDEDQINFMQLRSAEDTMQVTLSDAILVQQDQASRLEAATVRIQQLQDVISAMQLDRQTEKQELRQTNQEQEATLVQRLQLLQGELLEVQAQASAADKECNCLRTALDAARTAVEDTAVKGEEQLLQVRAANEADLAAVQASLDNQKEQCQGFQREIQERTDGLAAMQNERTQAQQMLRDMTEQALAHQKTAVYWQELFEDAQEQITTLQATVSSLSLEGDAGAEASTSRLQTLEEELSALQAAVQAHEDEKVRLGSAWHRQQTELLSQVAAFTDTNERLQRELEEMQEQRDEQIQETLASVQQELETLRDRAQQWAEQNSMAQEEQTRAIAQVQELEMAREDLSEALQAAQADYKLEVVKAEGMQAEVALLRSQAGELQTKLDRVEAGRAAAMQAIKDDDARQYSELKVSFDAVDEERAQISRKVGQLQQLLEDSRRQVAVLEQEVAAGKADEAEAAAHRAEMQMLSAYKDRIKTLEKQVATMTMELTCHRLEKQQASGTPAPSTDRLRKRASPTTPAEEGEMRVAGSLVKRPRCAATEVVQSVMHVTEASQVVEQDDLPTDTGGLASLASSAPAPSPFIVRRGMAPSPAPVAMAPLLRSKAAKRKSLVTFKDEPEMEPSPVWQLSRVEGQVDKRDALRTINAPDSPPVMKPAMKKTSAAAAAAAASGGISSVVTAAKRVPAATKTRTATKMRTRRATAAANDDEEADCNVQ